MTKKKSPVRSHTPIVAAVQTAAEKVNVDSWARTGALIGSLVLTVAGGHLWTQSNVSDRMTVQKQQIDSSLQTHWMADRAHKDSLHAASDSLSAIRDSLILRKLDTLLHR